MFKKSRVYLDYAAGVLGNPFSPHQEGRRAKDELEAARTQVARLTETKADDVVFTSSATEANALALLGAVRALPGTRHVLYLPSAHASVVENVRLLAEEGVAIEALPIRDARVDVEKLATLIRPETVLVSMDAVCGETGIVWNTREVRHVLDAARGIGETPVLLHVDASQAPLAEKISRSHFGGDLITFDGGKLGVRGVGVLVARRVIPLTPLYAGGGQERGVRSGTENVEAIAAFAHALEKAVLSRDAFKARAQSARALLVEGLSDIPNIRIHEGPEQAPHILSISLLGRDTDYLAALLDEAGFAVSTKSACETDSETGSRAVLALTGDEEEARATLRISWGPNIRVQDMRRFLSALRREITFIDSGGA
jgi:cysteine desulfurase